MERSRDFWRVWRRVSGIGAFGLFVAGLLVAIDLEELVVIGGALTLLCAAAGVVTWLLVHFRRALARAAVTGGRATAHTFVQVARLGRRGGARVGLVSARAGRATGRAVAAGGAEAARATDAAARWTAPRLRRADEELGVRVRAAGGATKRHVARAVAVVVSDIHAHREAARTEARLIAQRSRAAGRPAARRSGGAPRRGRA